MPLKTSFFLKIGFVLFLGLYAESKTRSRWESQFLFENYNYVQAQDFEKSLLNPDNRVFQIPRALAVSEIRPQFSVSRGSAFRFLVRPRWILDTGEAKLTNPEEIKQQAKGRVDLSDAYVESEVSSYLRVTLGLQVYQWGPAELLSPSNPIFHFSSQARSSFYKEKGKILARANIDWNANFNTILMAEPVSNREPEFVAQSDFASKFLVRNEYRASTGLDYIGFVFGREELLTGFTGQYFNWTPSEGWSLYADAKQNYGRISYKPFQDNLGVISLGNTAPATEVYSLATTGVRYEGACDYRMEYIFNEAGWTKEEFKQSLASTQQLSIYTLDNIARFQKSGLELLGQHYLYLSVRIPDLGKKKDLSVSFRSLVSLQDSSSSWLSTLEKAWGDAVTIYAEIVFPMGPTLKELNLLGQKSALLGMKWSL